MIIVDPLAEPFRDTHYRKPTGLARIPEIPPAYLPNLYVLQSLLTRGLFHHATYRDIGKCWEGLCIYARHPDGFQGYQHVLTFLKTDPDLNAAHALVANTGVSVGCYGRG